MKRSRSRRNPISEGTALLLAGGVGIGVGVIGTLLYTQAATAAATNAQLPAASTTPTINTGPNSTNSNAGTN
jgi:hypothetical protein